MELTQSQTLLTKRDVNRMLRRMGSEEALENLDWMLKHLWELHEYAGVAQTAEQLPCKQAERELQVRVLDGSKMKVLLHPNGAYLGGCVPIDYAEYSDCVHAGANYVERKVMSEKG